MTERYHLSNRRFFDSIAPRFQGHVFSKDGRDFTIVNMKQFPSHEYHHNSLDFQMTYVDSDNPDTVIVSSTGDFRFFALGTSRVKIFWKQETIFDHPKDLSFFY